jgi:hypothetical protein
MRCLLIAAARLRLWIHSSIEIIKRSCNNRTYTLYIFVVVQAAINSSMRETKGIYLPRVVSKRNKAMHTYIHGLVRRCTRIHCSTVDYFLVSL